MAASLPTRRGSSVEDLEKLRALAESHIDEDDDESGGDSSAAEDSERHAKTQASPGDTTNRKRKSMLQIQNLLDASGSAKHVDVDSEGEWTEDDDSRRESIDSHESVHTLDMADLGTPPSSFYGSHDSHGGTSVAANAGIAFLAPANSFFAANASDDSDAPEDCARTTAAAPASATASTYSMGGSSVAAFFAANVSDESDTDSASQTLAIAPSQPIGGSSVATLFTANSADDSDADDTAPASQHPTKGIATYSAGDLKEVAAAPAVSALEKPLTALHLQAVSTGDEDDAERTLSSKLPFVDETPRSVFANLETPSNIIPSSSPSSLQMSDDGSEYSHRNIASACKTAFPFSQAAMGESEGELSTATSAGSTPSRFGVSSAAPLFKPPPPPSRPSSQPSSGPPSRPRTPGAGDLPPPPPPPQPKATQVSMEVELSAALLAALGDVPEMVDDFMGPSEESPTTAPATTTPTTQVVSVARSHSTPPAPLPRSPSTPNSDRPKTPLEMLFDLDTTSALSPPSVLTPMPVGVKISTSPSLQPSRPRTPTALDALPPPPPPTAPSPVRSRSLPEVAAPPIAVPATAASPQRAHNAAPFDPATPNAAPTIPPIPSPMDDAHKRRVTSWPPPADVEEKEFSCAKPREEIRRNSNADRRDAYLQGIAEHGGSSPKAVDQPQEEQQRRGSNVDRREAYLHSVHENSPSTHKSTVIDLPLAPESRPSIKANKLNLDHLLQRSMEDKNSGVDAAQAVRRLSMMKANPEAMQLAAQAAMEVMENGPEGQLRVVVDDPITPTPPSQDTPVTRILARANSQRRLQSLTPNTATLSAFHPTISPARSASMDASPLLAINVDGLGLAEPRARKRGAVTAVKGPGSGTGSNRDSPVTQLYSRDLTVTDLTSIDDLFKVDCHSKDDDTLSSYTMESTTPMTLSRAKSVYQMLGEKKKSRLDLSAFSGSNTPVPPRPSQEELRASVQSFTSSIKRTMSQASMTVADMKKARAASVLEGKSEEVKSEDSVSPPTPVDIVHFPTLDGLDEDEDTHALFTTGAQRRLMKRKSISGNHSLASLNVVVDGAKTGIAMPITPDAPDAATGITNQRVSGPSETDLTTCKALMASLFPSLLPSATPASGPSASITNPFITMEQIRQQHAKLDQYFQILGDALRPGVLRVYRLIDIALNNNHAGNTVSAGVAPTLPPTSATSNSPSSTSSSVLAPVPRRRQSTLTMPPNQTAMLPITSALVASANPSSVYVPIQVNLVNRRMSTSPGSDTSRPNSVSSARSQSVVLQSVDPGIWYEPVVPGNTGNDIAGILELILQRHQRCQDAVSSVRVLLTQYLLYEKPEDVMSAAEAILDALSQVTAKPEECVDIDTQELYRLTKMLCLAFGAEDAHIQALRVSMEAIQSVFVHGHSPVSEHKDSGRLSPMYPSISSSYAISTSVLKTEAASICAQMMVYLIPCNLALIELLFRLSLIREAMHIHLQHYRNIYKTQGAGGNGGGGMSFSLSGMTTPMADGPSGRATPRSSTYGRALPPQGSLGQGTAGMTKEHYRYLRVFLRSLDHQLDLELALVDPILNRYTRQNVGKAVESGSGEVALAARLRMALRDLHRSKPAETPLDTPSGIDAPVAQTEDVMTSKSRCISGKSLVSKVQALLIKAEDLITRMQHFRDKSAFVRKKRAGYQRLSADSDSSGEDEDELNVQVSGTPDEDDLTGPLQDVFAQKEEMRKKIHSFHHAYLEEVDVLIKSCIHSPAQSWDPEDSPYANPTQQPPGCVVVGQKAYYLYCGLDRLSNRLWEESLKKDEVSLAAMCMRAQNQNLMASIFQTWPNLVFKIPQDHIPVVDQSLPTSPSYLLSSLSVASSVGPLPHSPLVRRAPPPPPQPACSCSHSPKLAAEVDLSGLDFSVPKTLRTVGLTLTMLWDCQCYSWPQLLSAGYPLQQFKQLRNAQNAAAQMHNLSCSAAAGPTASATAAPGLGSLFMQGAVSNGSMAANPIGSRLQGESPWQCHLTVLELRKAGYTIQQCRDAGFDAAALLAGGFTELDLVCSRLFSTKQLQRVGCDIQRLALKELFEYTEGRHWRNKSNWNTSEPISSWFGVWVDGRGVVVRLDLRGNGLSGRLPDSLCLLTGLQYVDLSGNRITGLISETWQAFGELKEVWLERNSFQAQEARSNKALLTRILPKCTARF